MSAAVVLPDLLVLLVDHDSRSRISLVFREASALLPHRSGREVDDTLLEAVHEGLVTGERAEGDGSIAIWSRVRLTLNGLRTLGQWPPTAREWTPGLWDDGLWGRRARPVLQRLRDNPSPHGLLFKPRGGDADPELWLDWTATLLLGEADLISGRVVDEGIDTVRITTRGREALDPRVRDPLDHADAQLRNGARVDAVVTAFELVLVEHLRELAKEHLVPAMRADGRPLVASRLNDALCKAGVYGEADRAQVEAWSKLRNDLAHPKAGTTVSDARVDATIAAIRVFVEEHPVGDALAVVP